MTEQLERKLIDIYVTKLRNSPAITCVSCLDLNQFSSQSVSPRLVKWLHSAILVLQYSMKYIKIAIGAYKFSRSQPMESNAIRSSLIKTLVLAIVTVLVANTLMSNTTMAAETQLTNIRVPAEWETQEAMWLQWPGRFERSFETSFAKMAGVISRYQQLRILYDHSGIKDSAQDAITAAGGNPNHQNIIWHHIPNNSSWMRDNGPVYVIQDGIMRIQNWEFNAWGGAFGTDFSYRKDNHVPNRVGELLNMPVDRIDIVHERGNLEFNGIDTVILNWSTIGDPARNPGYTREQASADLKRHFGVNKVVFVQGIPQGDLTRGHIDGIARFINSSTVVVPQCSNGSICQPGGGGNDDIYNRAAETIEQAGFQVIRDPIEGYVHYKGFQIDTEYMNWIVGNGFVIVVGFGNPDTDEAAKQRVESYFPGRDVYVIEMLQSWHGGGGAHCHTNDQPAASTIGVNW